MTAFPFHDLGRVTFTGALPATSDVVVIGGGVSGVTTALFLARAGHSVTVLEKGRIAGEQSGRNWGWIRQQGRDPDELPIMVEANGHWRKLAAETNVDIGLTNGDKLHHGCPTGWSWLQLKLNTEITKIPHFLSDPDRIVVHHFDGATR